MVAGDEKGVLSKVELILPANVVEACYNLERNVHAYFMAVNQQDKTSSEITLYKLKDDSVKIRVTVLALGDDDEEEGDKQVTPRGSKRKRREPEEDQAKQKKKPEPEVTSAKKGRPRVKAVKEEKEDDDEVPSTPSKERVASSEVEPSPGRLRTAKVADRSNSQTVNLEDFIPEDGDLTEKGGEEQGKNNQDEMIVVGGGDAKSTPRTPQRATRQQARQSPRQHAKQVVEEDYDEVEEDDEEEYDPDNTASTVITVKKTIKSEEEKQAERLRKVQMGRPWNWGKKTTLVYERKEKSLGRKEDELESTPKQTETLIIKNKAGKGTPLSAKKIAASIGNSETPKRASSSQKGDGPPPIVLASEDGAIISADALELNDQMSGTVQVQVINEQGQATVEDGQILEVSQASKGMSTPKIVRSMQPPMSAPAKVSVAKLKRIEDVPCQICDIKVGDYELLMVHIKKKHMDVDGVDDYLEEVQMEMQVECPVCGATVESQSALGVHIEQHHSHIGTEIRCEPCNKTYKSPASLKNHIRAQHTQRRRFECHVCNATFTENRSLKEHINCVHETTETFDCEICGKTFLTKGRLRRHKYIHQGFRHYCEYCNKGFHLRDNMNKHIEIMHEQKYGKRFQCNYCGKAFTVKGNLQQHILGVHLRKSLYECPICNEGFKRKSSMLEHMKAHARTKQEPSTSSMVEVVEPGDANEDVTSGEEDYDYVEFD